MATASHQHGGAQRTVATTTTDPAALLEQMLSLPVGQRQKAVNESIERRIEKVASVLPASLKDQAERFVKRAEVTFSRTASDPYKDIYTCTPESIVRSVIEAAEIGLAIDGKLCYAIPRKRTIKIDGRSREIRECTLQIDYKGLIVVARRSGQIKDAWARDVRDNDVFEHDFTDGVCHLRHTWDPRAPRGDTYAAFAIVEFGDKTWRYEVMDLEELEAIRKRSKAKDDGPWRTDTRQMYCKTVLRRILKLYCDDPAVGMALEIDEREFTEDLHPISTPDRPRSLAERIAAKQDAPTVAEPHDESYQESPPDDVDEPGAYESDEQEVES